jgi:tetratricopeptide (TPR) repeat protein
MFKLKIHFYLLPLIIFLAVNDVVFSQEVDIVSYLKKIESGNAEEVKRALVDLKEKNPDDPSVMFLDGVLTENGQEALVIYQSIVEKYPKSKYADAALYRIFSYYYALGLYETAQEKLQHLINNYPDSPYIKVANQNLMPDEIEVTEKKEEVTTKEQVKETVSNQDYKFTIQVGAFTNMENAQKLKQDFEKSGIFSKVGDKNVGGTIFHVVYAGQFVSYEDAENFLPIVNSKFNITGRIVPTSW